MFAVDKDTNALFLIDKDCEVSIIPKTFTNGINQYIKSFNRDTQGIGWVTQEYRNYGILG